MVSVGQEFGNISAEQLCLRFLMKVQAVGGWLWGHPKQTQAGQLGLFGQLSLYVISLQVLTNVTFRWSDFLHMIQDSQVSSWDGGGQGGGVEREREREHQVKAHHLS